VKSSLSLGAETLGNEMSHTFPFDYHVHECRSRDTENATLPAIVREAEEKGVREIALTTHLIVAGPDIHLSIRMDELDEYFRDIERAQSDTDVVLRAGLEVDYFPDEERRLEKIVDEHPLDYCLGSVHYINGVDIGSRGSGLFDVLAHPDYWRKFLQTVRSEPAAIEDYGSVYRDALRTLAEEGVGFEVNTSSTKVGLTEFYPVQGFLKAAYESGVSTVTVGSDTHTPSKIGYRLDEAAANLRRAGYESISTFRGRRNQKHQIDGLNP